ncbi:thioredoxin family protein [Streptococcus tangpeifui]|uniref:thioredoxin family protein n=1 Tax=Streptococcus tangpeifui TaxID=2709400 RepID=UPI0013EC68C2|nr:MULTISPECIES: thioredoxin family protein [unclassified Streptococcus]
MNRYKSLLLFSATALLLVGGTTYADEVSQNADQGQVPAATAQADSQASQQATANQQSNQIETNQQEQLLTSSEETSQSQDSTAKQEEDTRSNNQEEVSANQDQQVTESTADVSTVADSDSQEGQEAPDISTEEYEANVAGLKQVTMADVYHMFDDPDGSYTLYLGRPTCIYCRKFSPVIKDFNSLSGGQVYYYNTDSTDFSSVAKEFLRSKIGVFVTPTVLHLEKGQIVSGQLGSGGTAQDLYNKVFKSTDTRPDTSQEVTPSQQSPTANEKAAEQTTDATVKAADSSSKTSDQSQTKEVVKSEKLDTNTLTKVINKVLTLFDRLLVKFRA